jgi:hypothetical protein
MAPLHLASNPDQRWLACALIAERKRIVAPARLSPSTAMPRSP